MTPAQGQRLAALDEGTAAFRNNLHLMSEEDLESFQQVLKSMQDEPRFLQNAPLDVLTTVSRLAALGWIYVRVNLDEYQNATQD